MIPTIQSGVFFGLYRYNKVRPFAADGKFGKYKMITKRNV